MEVSGQARRDCGAVHAVQESAWAGLSFRRGKGCAAVVPVVVVVVVRQAPRLAKRIRHCPFGRQEVATEAGLKAAVVESCRQARAGVERPGLVGKVPTALPAPPAFAFPAEM